MTKQAILTLLCTFFYVVLATAQCYPDRHNTSASSGWSSCESSFSPNAIRGESHWIVYDLGGPTGLGQMQLWNSNNPQQLTSGAKRVVIDYSLDGENWEEFGEFDVEAATGSGFYEGAVILDFDRLTTRHLLITLVENHGGDCYGFAELKIETFAPVRTSELSAASFLKLYPSPAMDFTQVSFHATHFEKATLSVLDLSGKELMADNLIIQSGENLVTLDVAELVSGQYFVRLKSDHLTHTAELTIINN